MSQDVARAGLLDFSPTFNPPSSRKKENDAPVLSLVQFSRSPFVSFGSVKLGSSKSLPLRIENPSEEGVATVTVDKISSSKGFSLDQTCFTIQVKSVIVTVTWTPVEEGGVRELLSFVANGIIKHQAILLGKAEAPKKKKKSLWDSIKSKRDLSSPSKSKKVASMPIKAANKTFHVSRQHYRAYKQRNEYRALKQATFLIQRRYRAKLLAKQQREKYCSMQKAAITLQAAYRGMQARKRIAEMQLAAKIIQRKYRAYKQRNEYCALKQVTIVIQGRYRAKLLAKQQRQRYCSMQKAAITLQAAYRGMRVRKEAQKRQEAATVLQAWYRMYRVKMAFQAMRLAAVLVQRRYRCHLERKEARERFVKLRHSAIVVQAVFRGNRTRREIGNLHSAATVIQRKYLAYKERKKFLSVRDTVVHCQQKWRAVLASRQQLKAYLAKRSAAIAIQAAFRGMKVRRRVQIERKAAITIQAHVRMHKTKVYYQRLLWATKTVQRRYRANQMMKEEMKSLKQKRMATVVLQAAFRGMKARHTLKQKHKAAIVIQSAYRAHCAQTRYLCMRYAAVAIQQRYRATLAARKQREHFLQLRCASISLQACFRGQRARREIGLQHQAAKVIQASFRSHRERTKYQAMRVSAMIIQRHFRAYIVAKDNRERYLSLRKSAILIQTLFRGYSVRHHIAKMHKAATTIQAALRMHKHRSAFKRQSAIVLIQSAYRGHYCRVQYARMQKSAVLIQQWYRSRKLVQKHRDEFKRIQKATLTLQRALRRMVAMRLATRRRAAIKIQSVLHMHVHRRRYLKLRSCAVMLQAQYRMCTMRRAYLKKQTAAVTVQTFYRAYRAKVEQRECYLRTLRNVRTLQAHVRGFIQHRRFQQMKEAGFRAYKTRKLAAQTRAALKIQAWFRGHQARRDYISKQTAVATIHRCLQTKFQRARCSVVRRSIQKERNAAVLIQSTFRGYRQRQAFKQKKASALLIQRRFRAVQLAKAEKERRRRRNAAAVTIQAFCRGWLTRQKVRFMRFGLTLKHRFTAAAYHHLCAVRIQRALRTHWALKAAKKQISSVIYVQRWFKAKFQRKRYLEQRQKIITAQRAVKAWLNHRNQAATVIQHAAKRFLLRRKKERLKQGILKVQALWRGHCSRKLHDTTKVISMRHRFRKVNSEAKEEDKLCNKTATALSYLLGYQNYAYILAALKHLETATRLSPECCERLVNSGATRTIFTLIRSCNRSVPSMEIITLAIQVLLNLSKYNKTIDAVYEVPDSVDTLLDLLQIYREKAGDKVADKGGSIFTKACFLLVILVQDERRAIVSVLNLLTMFVILLWSSI
uniref:Abnormal spindle-like microcephaly-associated protein ASH domain-containing protein n=1 Tax=Astyanax mexicanus TaxID=7994 RepID=A0A3B1J9Y6_ASTMX